MKRIRIILMGFIAWGVFIVPTSAVAHTSHAGIHAQSPFEASKAKQSPHCALQGHQHSALPYCPHSMQDRNRQTQFKADCGDHHSGTQVQTSWSKTFLILKSIVKVPPGNRNRVTPSAPFLLSSLIPDPLDKPPQ